MQSPPDHYINAGHACFRPNGELILKNISFSLRHDESLAITGHSGSGKTTLAKLIAGEYVPTAGSFWVSPELKTVMVDQQDHFATLSGQRSVYYGQRYEYQGVEHSPSIRGYLQKIAGSHHNPDDEVATVMKQMGIDRIADRHLMQLSNGERKRTQLAAALLQKPDILILDQPFVGLDAPAREMLGQLLVQLKDKGTRLVLICSPEHIPPRIDRVLELRNGEIGCFVERHKYSPPVDPGPNNRSFNDELIARLPQNQEEFEFAVKMRSVNVTLNNRPILKGIDWTVRKGERWALLGHNGAGKTTLLSLITADNPQGYTNNLVLFDRQRGSGESIWDIKKRIGYVSPELHLYFLRGSGIFNTIPGLGAAPVYNALTCADVIISGLHDQIGSVTNPTSYEENLAKHWLTALQMGHLPERPFVHASLGEQRALLLARALVKTPSLLILDEPCQGLDPGQTREFIALLDELCPRLGTTLIYVTHYREEIPTCVHNVLELEEGRVKP
jgi:molybdate transport system ATP-binding protein